MVQPSFTAIRQALASQLAANITSLNTVAAKIGSVNPPAAVVMPVTGSFVRYSTTVDGAADLSLRVILLVSEGDGSSGMDIMDPYLATSGAQSVYAAIQKDPTLGRVVDYAAAVEVTAYGLMNWAGIDYLAAHVIVNVGI